LIFPFVVELAQLDTAATGADPDGAGPLTSGYDAYFREPLKVLAEATDQVGETVREETLVQIRAQIEPNLFESLQAYLGGAEVDTQFAIVAHFRDLEQAGLVDAATGNPLIRPRDRMTRILTTKGQVVQTIDDPPGLYVTEVQPRGFGPAGRNLLLIKFESRDQTVSTP